jgi:ryanodine receptor 2
MSVAKENQMYTPNPIDTSHIQLSGDIMALSEKLAKNIHEVWTAGRIAEGWTLGKSRDDKLKQHPCLVPYEDLPESEKDYDRATAMETLKFIINLGYVIQKSNTKE